MDVGDISSTELPELGHERQALLAIVISVAHPGAAFEAAFAQTARRNSTLTLERHRISIVYGLGGEREHLMEVGATYTLDG